jgi:putative membrane protein
MTQAPSLSIAAQWQRARQRALGLFVRGIGMGTADVIPGVSGGTMALITGIYDELVATIAGVHPRIIGDTVRGRFAAVLQQLNASFLVPLLAGIFAAVLSLAKGITYLLEHHPEPVWGALTGLILASVLVVARHIDGWSLATAVLAAVGAGIGYGVTILVPVETGTQFYKFVGAGIIASIAMILPGISGSFLLVLMGKYTQVLTAIHERELTVIGFFGIGFLAGILCFSRVLKRLLARHHTPTMAFLTGLMAGSLRKVWPFRLPIEGDLDHYLCVMPDNYDSETWLTIGLVVIAFGVVMVIERFAAKVSDDSSQR